MDKSLLAFIDKEREAWQQKSDDHYMTYQQCGMSRYEKLYHRAEDYVRVMDAAKRQLAGEDKNEIFYRRYLTSVRDSAEQNLAQNMPAEEVLVKLMHDLYPFTVIQSCRQAASKQPD